MKKYFTLLATTVLLFALTGLLAGCGSKAPEDVHAEIQTGVRSEIFRTARYDDANNITTEAAEAQFDMVEE